MTDGPFLWYLNRSSGFVILVMFTLTTVLGVLATRGRAGRGLPRFVTQSMHRNLALLSVVMLVVHIASAVADTFVDIRWWQAVVPYVGSTYRPLWLGLGAVVLDLTLVITLTSLLRARIGHRTWLAVHLLAYVGWALSVAHAWGIGTDVRSGTLGGAWITLACVVAVVAAVLVRLGGLVAGAGADPDAESHTEADAGLRVVRS